jgi:Flp pilus assembly protein TadD
VPEAPAAPEEPDPEAEARARIEAEIAPYLKDLQSGALTRADLARRFNAEGRQALQLSRFDEAIEKFSVAIHLDPKFAGAYSNRGTAYQKADQPELAAADFAKAKELGFGGFRLRDGSQPFN